MYFKILFIFCVLYLPTYFTTKICPTGSKLFRKGISQDDRNFILKMHNKIRRNIMKGKVPNQPKGYNLKYMKWDRQLENDAKYLALTCDLEVNLMNARWSHVGKSSQISYTNRVRGPGWNDTITKWYAHHKHFKYPKAMNRSALTYTQMIWGDTERIGCNSVTYKLSRPSEKDYAKWFICLYAPGGNVIGQAPYKSKPEKKHY